MVFHDLKLFFEERVLGNRISWVEAPQDRIQRRDTLSAKPAASR
jgi:hypothetical protein